MSNHGCWRSGKAGGPNYSTGGGVKAARSPCRPEGAQEQIFSPSWITKLTAYPTPWVVWWRWRTRVSRFPTPRFACKQTAPDVVSSARYFMFAPLLWWSSTSTGMGLNLADARTHKADSRSSLAGVARPMPIRSRSGQFSPNFGRTWLQGATLAPDFDDFGPRWGQVGPKFARVRQMLSNMPAPGTYTSNTLKRHPIELPPRHHPLPRVGPHERTAPAKLHAFHTLGPRALCRNNIVCTRAHTNTCVLRHTYSLHP